MRFPNAHKGLKKIKTSVVLEIISLVVMLVGAIISMVVLDKVGNGTAPAELTQYVGSIQFCMIAGGLVSVIAVTMRIVGAVGLLAVAAVVLLIVFRGKNRKQAPRHEEPEEEMEFQPYQEEEQTESGEDT